MLRWRPLFFLRRYGLYIVLTTLMGITLTYLSVKTWVIPMYQARTSLLILPAQTTGPLSPLFSQLEPHLAQLGPLQAVLSGQRFHSSLKDLMSILRSRRLAEVVTQKVELRDLPEFQRALKRHPKANPQRFLMTWLIKQLEILPPDNREGTLRLQIRLSDPQRAALLCNTYIAELERFVRTLQNQETQKHQRYLEAQLKQLSQELHAAEDEQLRFQRRHRLVSLNEEVKEIIHRLAELEAEELTTSAALRESQAKLKSLQEQSTGLNPAGSEISQQLSLSEAGLEQRQAALRQSRERYERLLASLPLQALELARLERRVTLKNQLYILLSQQLQAARLEAARHSSLFYVLDRAIPADEPIFPVFSVILIISGIISMGIGILLALLHDAANLSKESDDAEIQMVYNRDPLLPADGLCRGETGTESG